MDSAKAIGVLEWWIEHAEAVRSRGEGKVYDFGHASDARFIELRAHEDQTRRILHRVLGLDALPTVLHKFSSSAVSVAAGIDLCRYAIGRLTSQAETDKILGSSAPTMAADSLHPLIWNAASERWASRHYSDAVQRAATFLNAEIQSRIGRTDVSDSNLMGEAFSMSPPTHDKPRCG